MKYFIWLIFCFCFTQAERIATSLYDAQESALQYEQKELERLDKKSAVERAEQREEALEKEINVFKKKIAKLEEKRNTLKNALENKEGSLEKMETALASKEAELARIEQRLDQEDRDLHDSYEAHKMKDALISSFQKTKDWFVEHSENLKQRLKAKCHEVFGLQKNLEQTVQEKDAQRKALKDLQIKQKKLIKDGQESYARKYKKVEEEAKKARTERDMLKQEYATLLQQEQKHAQCHHDMKRVQKEHNQCVMIKNALTHQKDQLTASNVLLRKKLAKTEKRLEDTQRAFEKTKNRCALQQ